MLKGGSILKINQVMRRLPNMTELLEKSEVIRLIEKFNKNIVNEALDLSLEELRQKLLNKAKAEENLDIKTREQYAKVVISKAKERLSYSPYSLKRVVNATGVVLHTNLGRAPLPKQALKRINEVSQSYSNLEYNLDRGERGERYNHVRDLLCDITGAEDALVVNNNAAAVLLSLSALASGKEVVISRGQLVEIGGSFRIPDVMTQSGAKLVEIGTTNKTHLRDYEIAINENTALILKVHTSNFKIMGFSTQVSHEELVSLGKKYEIPVMEDLGSGVLLNLNSFQDFGEPTVSDSIKAGVDMVTFSGDKLLGGPQAGIIVGTCELISKIKQHPLTRAVRIDKLTLSALEAVLMLYKYEQYEEIPLYNMLSKSEEKLQQAAEELAYRLKKVISNKGEVAIVDDVSEVGGGALPGEEIPTKAVAIKPKNVSVETLATKLRHVEIPVIGRIKNDRLLLDVRTMSKEDIKIAVEMVMEAL